MALGIALADRQCLTPQPALLLGLVALMLGLVARGRPRLRALAASILFLAAGAYSLGTRIERARAARPRRPMVVTVEGTRCAGELAADWASVELCQVERVRGLGFDPVGDVSLPRRVRVIESRSTAASEWLASLCPGERVRVRLRLRPPRSWSNPGSRDRVRPLDRRGVGALASLVAPGLGARLPERDSWRPGCSIQALRRGMGEELSRAGPGGGLLRALAIGDRSALSSEQRQAFARLGIGHLLAVSGLHLGLAAGLAYALLRAVLVRIPCVVERGDARLWALAGALGCALVYAVLAGWGIPVRRALVFLLALGLGLTLGRRRSGIHVFAAAAIAVLVFEPGALFDAGAQLSFAASAGLLASLRGSASASRLTSALTSLLRTSATAVAATAPLLAWHLGSVTPLGLAANLVAVPWTAAALLPTALAAAAATLLPASPATELMLTGAERLARFTLAVAEGAAAALPGAAVGARPALWILAVAAALAIGVARSRRTRWRVLLAVASLLLLRWGPIASVPPSPPRLVSLDVGQGDATLIQGRRGALLVDAGRAIPGGVDLGRRVVLPALRALRVDRLDLVVATHADIDHWGGLPSVLAGVPVGELWLPSGAGRWPAFEPLLQIAQERGVRVRECALGDEGARFGDLLVTPVWPPAEGPVGASRNDRSLVLRVELEGVRTLLTGDLGVDAEHQLLTQGVDLRAEILKLGHHGSRSSSSPAFLEAVGAEVALLSAPCPGPTALPSGAIVERVRASELALWWTGRDGAIFAALGPEPAPLAVWGWEPVERCDAPPVP